MKLYDLAVCLISAFLIAKNLYALFSNTKVKVKGAVSGQTVANIILSLLVCWLVFFKRASFEYWYIAPIGMVIFVLTALPVKSGITADGVLCSGKHTAFSDMEFYAIEMPESKRFILRVRAALREYVLTFPQEARESVEAALAEGGVKRAERAPREQPK